MFNFSHVLALHDDDATAYPNSSPRLECKESDAIAKGPGEMPSILPNL